MKTMIAVLAGTMLTSAAFAAAGDSFAEERFRIKYGRRAPAAEAGQSQANNHMKCMENGRCQHMSHGTAAVAAASAPGNDAAERFRAKYGRLPGAEVRSTETRLAADRGARAVVAQNQIDNEARFRAKFGRSTAANEKLQGEELLLATTTPMTCEMACHCGQN